MSHMKRVVRSQPLIFLKYKVNKFNSQSPLLSTAGYSVASKTNVANVITKTLQHRGIAKEIGSDEKNVFNVDQMILNSSKEGYEDIEIKFDENDESFASDDEIAAQILNVALEFVPQYGWSDRSISEAVKVLELSPSSAGMFKRGGVELVLHFNEECNNKLSKHLAKQSQRTQGKESGMNQAEFIEYAVKTRLEMIAQHIDSWSEALKLLASPSAVVDCMQLGAHLIDEIWYFAGDMATDMSWYSKRATLSGIYVATELYMLSDKSENFSQTWEFLHNRLNEIQKIEKVKSSVETTVYNAYNVSCAGVTILRNILGLNHRGR